MTDDFEEYDALNVDHRQISSDRSPSDVERQVCSVTDQSPLDDVCAMIDAADWLLARAKSIQQVAAQRAIQWIDRNGEFTIGDLQYGVGYNTTVRCTNTKQCGNLLLEALEGDLNGFFGILVAQPYKPGSARQVLPDAAYRQLFEVKRTSRLVAGLYPRVLKRDRLGFRRY